MSIADLQYLSDLDNGNLEFDLPDLEKCSISINSDNKEGWIKVFKDGNKDKFHLYSKEEKQGAIYVDIDTIEQLSLANQYINLKDSYEGYRGWFGYDMSDQEMKSQSIIWAENKNENDGTRFGIKVDGENMFKIAMNRGTTFVYLDSFSEQTLENFLGQNKEKNDEQEYETDSEYADEGRDYDD